MLCFYLGISIDELRIFHVKPEKLSDFEIKTVLVALMFNVSVNVSLTLWSLYNKIKMRFISKSSKISQIPTNHIEIQSAKF